MSRKKDYLNQHYNTKSDMESFYKYLSECDFSEITLKKLIELIHNSKKLNKFYTNTESEFSITERYIKVMNTVKTNPKTYGALTQAERYLLFMFAIDPTFEATIIYASLNKTDEIKQHLFDRFGVYDKNLVAIEKYYIKRFLSPKKKEAINEEINRRIYK